MGSDETVTESPAASSTKTDESNQTRRSSQRRSKSAQNSLPATTTAAVPTPQPDESEKTPNNKRKSSLSTNEPTTEQAQTPRMNTRTKKKTEPNQTPKQESIKPTPAPQEDLRLKWKVGSVVEARDVSNNWYKSRIVELDKINNRAKIHFFGWNSRYDQWFGILSGDLRPTKGQSSSNEEISTEITSLKPETSDDSSHESKFPIGMQVLAKWIDDGFYPARINRHLTKTEKFYYEVKFYDGVKKLVRFDNVKELTEQDRKLYDEASLNATATIVSTSEETAKEDENESDRRAEAELLLAIQKPQLILASETSEVKQDEVKDEKLATKTEETKIESEFVVPKSSVEAKEENKIITETEKPTPESTPTPAPVQTQSEDLNVRKSLRVKRLRTYTDEIVFDSPASSITYNLASVSNPLSLLPHVEASTEPVSAKKRKPSADQTKKEAEKAEAEVAEAKKEENTKTVQNYFKSLKLFKSTRKGAGKTMESDSNAPRTSRIRKPNQPEVLPEEEEQKALEPDEPKFKSKKEKKRYLKKLEKKLRKKNKENFLKQLIQSTQQLKQQQELIEKELKKHEDKKSKKKLQKLLKKQQVQPQPVQQIPHYPINQTVNVFFPPDNAFFKHQTSSFFPNSPYILPITPQIKVPNTPMLVHAQSNEPIVCTMPNCTKTFRKQSLLEYHLKYHHYVDLNSPMPLQLQAQAQANPMSPQSAPKRPKARATRRSSSNQTDTTRTNKDSMSNFGDEDSSFLFDGLDNLEDDDTADPYEVIHCKCGNHTSIGFMIQCEVCLCWQHGKCMSIESNEKTPKHYSCWICAEPGNKLRKLKYQSWMSSHLERELINRKDMRLLSQENKEVKETKPDVDYLKLKLINECSRKYYNLNLLMYTLEYQMSMLSKITSNETIRKELDERSRNEDYEFNLNENGIDHDIFSQIDKLALNVTHLQSCLTKKFEEFNSKLDGGFYLFLIL